jgi:dihydrodipicolinate synthase/N-acetylneuraminate lyase
MELPFLGELAKYGLLGILLGLSIFANWYFIQAIQKLNDKRIEDAKEITTKILEPLDTVKKNSELLISLFQQFLNNGNKKL